MNRARLMPNAIFIFIFSIVALVSSFVLYIYWYIEISSGLDDLVLKFDIDPHQVFESQTALVIVVLSLLVGFILMGLSMTFVYNQKMQQLYRLQNNFINNFTHELKTPVTSLKLYLETFQKHDLSAEDRTRFIDFMLRDVHRLSDNINNILDLGRIESKNIKGDFVATDLVSFIREFYLTNAHLFQGLRIDVDAPENGAIEALISRRLFEMLLINLATNALKYNDSASPGLHISMVTKSNKLVLRFADNGIGIARSERKKVFKKFYQVGHSDVCSAKGSGLGLYLVQNIVRAHEGQIRVEDNGQGLGKGSCFVLTLPIALKKTGIKRAHERVRSAGEGDR